MESKANYALIGVISILTFVLAAAFIYWFALFDSKVETKQYRIIFTGTVTGLSAGTDVLFNGIKVGQVRDLAIDPDDPGKVVSRIEVSNTAPVKVDTRVILEFQGLTGIAFVQLTGGTPGAADLLPPEGEKIATIVADKSDFQSLVDGLRDTISGASATFDRLNNFLDVNEPVATATLANIESFSAALASNATGVEAFLASLSEAGKEIGPLAGELRQLSVQVRGLLGDVKPGSVAKIVDDVSSFTEAVSRNTDKVDVFFTDATTLSASLSKSSEQVSDIIMRFQAVTDSLDPDILAQFVLNLDSISTVLGDNSENVDTFLSNMTEVSTTLAQSVDKVSAIVDNINNMTSDTDSEGLFKQLTSAAAAVQVLAENLDTRTQLLTTGLGRFTGQGLSEYQALAADARATLRRLDTLLSRVNANPQSLIFGGETVREYNKK